LKYRRFGTIERLPENKQEMDASGRKTQMGPDHGNL
jgi:hypothetical protein